jgi:16S rRNA (guanine527-N7)-methyltransferase
VSLRCSPESIAALGVPRETSERIAAWTDTLDRWQKAQRLVGWRDAELLLHEGIADAVAALPLLDDVPDGPWVDLGSGNGLPALILASAHPEQEFHLVESRRKRCSFLRAAATAMGLQHIHVHNIRAEDLLTNPDCPRPVLLSARAFVPPDQLPGHAEAWQASYLLVSSSRARLPKEGWPSPWMLHVEHPGRPVHERLHLLLRRA